MTEKSDMIYDPKDIESDMQEYWSKRGIRNLVLNEKRVGGKKHFIVHTPHMLHDTCSLSELYPKLLYDIWFRFQHMRGYNIKSIYGYDSFSLSVEQKALSKMGLESFDKVHEDELEDFIRNCQKIALEDKEIVEEEYHDMGFLYDPKKFYSTYPTTFIDSSWWTFKQLYERGLLEKKKALLPWCPKCRSVASKMDRNYSLEIKKEYLIKFPTDKGIERNFVVHMSEPWKIMDTVAIAVHPDKEYCVVEYESKTGINRSLVLKEKVRAIMKKSGIDDYKITNSIPGKKLDGIEYVNPFDYILDTFVTAPEGVLHRLKTSNNTPPSVTGLYPVTVDKDIRSLELMDEFGIQSTGLLNEQDLILDKNEMGRFAGSNTEDASLSVVGDLRREDLLLSVIEKRSTHELCIHCGSEFEHKEQEEWFFDNTDIREQIKDFIQRIAKIPKGMGSGKSGNWIDGSEDLFITRRDGWGLPIPLWRCKCKQTYIAETLDELAAKTSRTGESGRTMHMIRDIRILKVECPKCKEQMSWEGKMFNSLAISILSPWAQIGYPQKYIEGWWPGDIMFGSYADREGLFSGHLQFASDLFEEPPVEKLVGYGHLSLPQSELKNALKRSGGDPLRMAMVADKKPWEDHELSYDALQEPRKGLRVLWNVFQFYLKEAEKRNFNPDEAHLEFLRDYMRLEDRWLLSRLENLNMVVKESYRELRFDLVVKHIEDFIVGDIAQWYIYLVRERLKSKDQRTILAVLKVLHQSLLMTSKMLAPVAPYISGKMYLKLESEKYSVFMCEWPVTNRIFIDEVLEKEMADVQNIVENILMGKRKAEMPEKWPLKRIVVDAEDMYIISLMERYGDIVKKKALVKEIELVGPGVEWEEMILTVQPNYNAIGKSYRQWVSRIALMLEKRPAKEIRLGIERGEYKLGIEGGIVDIQPNMVTFEKELPEGFSAFETGHGGIYLDSEIDPGIWSQEIFKEILLRLKSMRNDLDMEEEDEVEVFVHTSDDILEMIEENLDSLKTELNARTVHFGEEDLEDAEYLVEWDLEGHTMMLPDIEEMVIDLGLIPLYRTKMIELYQSIPGMSEVLAEKLYEAGYTTLSKLENASAEDISGIEDFKRSLGRRIIQAVQKHDEIGGEEIGEPETAIDEERRMQRLLKTLQQVDGIGPARAKAIYKEGYTKYTDFLAADISELTNISHVTREHAMAIKEAIREEYGTHEETYDEPEEEIQVEITEEDLVEKEPEEDLVEEEPEEDVVEEVLPSGISRSTTYMVLEESGDILSINMFKDIMEAGLKGLLVTRQFPKKVMNKYGFKDVSLIWLSNVDKENAVRPKNLEKFSLNLERFLNEEQGVILLSGIDYLITNNDFRTVLHLIQSLKDQVAIKESIMIIPVSEKTLDQHQIDMLENEVDEVIKG